MKKVLSLLIAIIVLVCAQFQNVKAQNSFSITDMEISVKYSANIANIAMFSEDSTDFKKKFPIQYDSLGIALRSAAVYSQKARGVYVRHHKSTKRYHKFIGLTEHYYTLALAIYNRMLAKESKPAYQEITKEDDIVRIYIFMRVWAEQKKVEQKARK